MSVLRRFGCALLACLLVGPVHAWGPLGHAIVADLAQRHLSPTAQAQVHLLLASEPTQSLAAIASWPDQIQDDPTQAALWKQTRPLHYINFHAADCDYVPPRDCRDGRCVIGALEHYVAGRVVLPSAVAPLQNVYAQWARESCRITAQPGFYPSTHKVDQAYVDAELPVAELRLREAGRRLAAVLNLALSAGGGVARGK